MYVIYKIDAFISELDGILKRIGEIEKEEIERGGRSYEDENTILDKFFVMVDGAVECIYDNHNITNEDIKYIKLHTLDISYNKNIAKDGLNM